MPFVTRVASRVLMFSCSRGRSRFRTDGRTVPVYKPRRDGTARPQNFRASTILWGKLATRRNHDIDISLWYKLFGLRHAANACSSISLQASVQLLRRTRFEEVTLIIPYVHASMHPPIVGLGSRYGVTPIISYTWCSGGLSSSSRRSGSIVTLCAAPGIHVRPLFCGFAVSHFHSAVGRPVLVRGKGRVPSADVPGPPNCVC